MRVRKLSPDGDMVFGSGQLDFYRDIPEAPAQCAKTRLLLWLGEWFLDTTEGTPFMTGILGKHSKTTADITIQNRVSQTQGVTTIQNYASEIDPDTRAMSATMDLDTIYGPTPLTVSNYVNY